VFLDSIIKSKLNEEDKFVKLNIKLNIKGRQEYYGIKYGNKYYIFNINEWKEKSSSREIIFREIIYRKIIYLVDFNEEELYKIDELYKKIEEGPSKFFDNLFNKFYKYTYEEADYNFLFLSLLKKNKLKYEYIIIIDIKGNEIYNMPNIYKFLLKKISMEISYYISNDPHITTIIKTYKNGKFLEDFLIFYNYKTKKYEILENIGGKIISENIEYNKRELVERIIESIR
jgi:hypothetical protein